VFRVWTIFISPVVFNINNTLVHFTSFNLVITIIVTVIVDFINVRSIDVIRIVDGSITVFIIVRHHVNDDLVDIITSPFSVTFSIPEWAVTNNITVTWAVFISPFVFNDDNTFVDFTRVNSSVIVEITFSLDIF